jgi:hypothetical protein
MAGYDQLFKGLLRTFFGDFLALVSPQAAESLDASRAIFLDKEFFTDWPRGRRREIDLLARVPVRNNADRSVLVHIEIEVRGCAPALGAVPLTSWHACAVSRAPRWMTSRDFFWSTVSKRI